MVICWFGFVAYSTVCVSGIQFHKYVHDATMLEAEIVGTSLHSAAAGCVDECDRTSACRAIRLHEDSGTCQLLSAGAQSADIVTSWSGTEHGWEVFVHVSCDGLFSIIEIINLIIKLITPF